MPHDESNCKSLICAVNRGNLINVKKILQNGKNKKTEYALYLATSRSQLEIISVILLNTFFTLKDMRGFVHACRQNYIAAIDILLKDGRLNPGANENIAITATASSGNLEIMKLLIDDNRADPSANMNEPIFAACKNGHIEMLKLLMEQPSTDPSDDDNRAFKAAFMRDDENIQRLLLTDIRVWYDIENYPIVMENLKSSYYTLLIILKRKNIRRLTDVLYQCAISSMNNPMGHT